eukprot:139402_1
MSQALKLLDLLLNQLDEDKHSSKQIQFNKGKYNILFLTKYLKCVEPEYNYLINEGHNCNIIATNTRKELGEKFSHHIFVEGNVDYDAIIMHSTTIGAKILNQLRSKPTFKLLSLMSSGYDHIDIEHCKKLGIHVTNISPSMGESVSDYIIGLMLSLCRGLFFANKNQWNIIRSTFTWNYRDLHSTNVGIIGLGNIGKSLSKKLHLGFNCNVYYYNKNGPKTEYDKTVGATYVNNLSDLLNISDFVIPLCPLNDNTKYMFNKKTFGMMKNDAWFINVGRGKLCDTNAIIYALENKLIGGAALDCTDPEPLDENTLNKLHSFDNCIVMPHIGSFTRECKLGNTKMAVQNALKVLSNQPCSNIIC